MNLNNSVSIRLGVEGDKVVNEAVREIGRTVRTTMDQSAAATEEAGRKFDQLARRLDPVAAAAARLANAQAIADRAVASGARSQEDASRLIEAAQARYAVAAQKTVETTGLARHEMVNLGRQAQDVAVSLAGGQSPMMVLMQQGSQVADIFTSSKAGPTAALRSLGATAASVATSVVGIGAVVVGSLGVAGYAYASFIDQQRQLERALNGVGRAAGASADGLRAYGVAGAARAGLSGSQGVELAGQFAGTGRISGQMIPGLIEQSARYSRVFGTDLADAAKEIGDAFASPAKGADKLNERLGFLDAATRQNIRTLEAQGNVLGAQRALFAAFSADLATATERTGLLERAWRSIKGAWGSFEQGVGSLVDPSIQQRIDVIEGMTRRRNVFGTTTRLTPAQQSELEDLRRQLREAEQKAEQQRIEQDARRRSIEADDLVRQIRPELGERQGLTDRKALLESALGDPEVVKRLGVAADDAKDALGRVSTQLANWRTPLGRLVQDGALAVQGIEAVTFAQKASVAAEQARLAVLRESGDTMRAAAAAENARNELIAQGNRRGDEMVRDAARSLSLAGLDPRERARRQIDFEIDDFKRAYAPKSGDLKPYEASGPFASLTPSVDRASKALDALASSAGRASGAVGGGASSLPIFAQGSALLDAIMRAEGTARTGDPYNTSLGYRRSPKPLTSMTLDESLAWGEQIARDEMAKRGISRGEASSAKGAFQIVNSTQRDAMKALGLSGDMLFSPEIQRQMAMWIFKTQGIGAWEGFKNGGAANDNPVRPLASRAGEQAERARQDRYREYDQSRVAEMVRDANNEIEQQNRLLDANVASFGKSTKEIAQARKEQELRIQAVRMGLPIDDELAQKFAEIARRAGEVAQRSEDVAKAQGKLVGAMDGVRSGARDLLGTFVSDLRNGQSASKSFEDAITKLADKLISVGLDKLIEGIFGETGKVGGGVGGGMIAQFFKLLGFAEGGVMSSAGPIPLRTYAAGGVAYSPQFSIFGEGGSPEAYVPLRSGAIPVTLHGRAANSNQAQAAPVFVNVIGAPKGARTEESTDSRGGRRIDVILDENVARSMASDRGAQAMAAAYGARRVTAQR